MGTTVKLRNVRVTYPHIGVPDRFGKYSLGVLVPKGSPAHDMLMQKLREAWAAASDTYGRALFEPNPTNARLLRAAYIKDGDGEDASSGTLSHRRMLQQVDRYIREHYMEEINLAELADMCNLHPNYFHRLYTAKLC